LDLDELDMKIAILSSIYPSSILPDSKIKKYGLKIRYDRTGIHNLVESLVRYGKNRVHLISICNEFESDFSYERNGVVYDFVKPSSKYVRGLTHFEADKWCVQRFLRKGNFDIVHGQGLTGPGLFAATSALPHVVTIHIYNNSFWETIEYHLRYRLKRKMNFKNLYFGLLGARKDIGTLIKAKHFICSSKFISEKLKRKKIRAKLFNVENAVSSRFFEPGQNRNEGFALFLGSIQDRKSVLELVHAVNMSKQCKLKIVSGTGSGEYYKKVRRYIWENNLEGKVDFLGQKRNDEVVDILRKCSFLVLPSKKEGAPVVIGEAMAVGKPVIASNIDGIPYMIKDGKTGYLIEPGNIEQLAEKIDLLINNEKLCNSMGRLAKKEAADRWHPNVIASETMRVYESILLNQDELLRKE